MGDGVNPRSKEPSEENKGDRRPGKGASARYSQEEQGVRQHIPPGLSRRPGNLYISCQAAPEVTRGQQEQARKLLQKPGGKVWLHSLGPSIPWAVSLASRLQREVEGLQVDSFTSTREGEGLRNNSGLHIRIIRS